MIGRRADLLRAASSRRISLGGAFEIRADQMFCLAKATVVPSPGLWSDLASRLEDRPCLALRPPELCALHRLRAGRERHYPPAARRLTSVIVDGRRARRSLVRHGDDSRFASGSARGDAS